MRPCGLIMSLLLILLLAVSVASAWPELVNPGLEVDTDQDGLPDGWRKYVSPNGRAEVAIDRAVKRSGAGSVRVTLADKSRCALSQWVPLTETGPVTFGCHVRSGEAAVTVAQVQVQWFCETRPGEVLALVKTETPSPPVSLTSGWLEIATAATRPENADRALVAIIIGDRRTPAGTFWAADAYLKPGVFPKPLVANPGFELDSDGDGRPDNWGRGGEGEGFELVRDTKVFKAGQASVRLTGRPGHGSRIAVTQTTGLMPVPRVLRIKLWYRGQGKADGVIDILPPVGVKASLQGVYFDRIGFDLPKLSDEWQQIVLEREMTAEARQVGQMRLGFILYQKGQGDLWYDEIEAEFVD